MNTEDTLQKIKDSNSFLRTSEKKSNISEETITYFGTTLPKKKEKVIEKKTWKPNYKTYTDPVNKAKQFGSFSDKVDNNKTDQNQKVNYETFFDDKKISETLVGNKITITPGEVGADYLQYPTAATASVEWISHQTEEHKLKNNVNSEILNKDEELIINIEELANELAEKDLKILGQTKLYHELLKEYKQLILKHERKRKE